MVIWHFPGTRGTIGILIVTAIAAGLGYLSGGTNSAAAWAAIVGVGLFTFAWLWSTMEQYTQGS